MYYRTIRAREETLLFNSLGLERAEEQQCNRMAQPKRVFPSPTHENRLEMSPLPRMRTDWRYAQSGKEKLN